MTQGAPPKTGKLDELAVGLFRDGRSRRQVEETLVARGCPEAGARAIAWRQEAKVVRARHREFEARYATRKRGVGEILVDLFLRLVGSLNGLAILAMVVGPCVGVWLALPGHGRSSVDWSELVRNVLGFFVGAAVVYLATHPKKRRKVMVVGGRTIPLDGPSGYDDPLPDRRTAPDARK